ncbi:HEAT repeat domain-containing protein [Pleionea sp. CnH1-48]|uniref:HEAT repeat domain-containing protein n=1 Tax=Pleionea sp. CnH1-48 TaxID=2954494 RepID=UPI00209769BC|nr:HEAT repeat domain-containing protein [Pleionea sp. CnH1-48]MCO7223282.1 HEAT repeat domain-containing protein [Pleionea sp. CnH1-48]
MINYKDLVRRISSIFPKTEEVDELLEVSKSWDGRRREAAVNQLGVLGDPVALPMLILRANDWVPQVRHAARRAIFRLRKAENVEAFVESLPSFYHLRKCRRERHDTLIEDIERFLLDSRYSEHLIQGISNANPYVQRACFDLALENKLMPYSELVVIGLKQTDVVTRSKASDLIRSLEPSRRRMATGIAIKDTYMPIRREAFQIEIKYGLSTNILEEFLYDKSVSIREIAIKHLKLAGIDVISLYRQTLSINESVRKQRYSIWGLGYLGDTSSERTIKSYVASEYPSLRKQTLTSLVNLLGDDAFDALISSLHDKSPAVCRESARLILKLDILFEAKELLSVIQDSTSQHTLAACIELAKTSNKWERLIFLLDIRKLLESEKNATAKLAGDALIEWEYSYNRSQIMPTPTQIKEIKRRLPDIKGAFDGYGMRGLLFSLRAMGI